MLVCSDCCCQPSKLGSTVEGIEMSGFASFREFYPFYLGEHRNRTCRRLHFVGSSLALGFIVLAVKHSNPWWVLAALLSGYAFAWLGHFFFEKNKPATFKYPFWSLISDFKLFFE